MKKNLWLLIILITPIIGAAQEQKSADPRDTAKNELSVGALNLLAFGAIDITYERVLSPHSSWAVETFILAFNRDKENTVDAYEKDFSIAGKYKYFFSDRSTASGFYVNALTMVSSGDYTVEEDYSTDQPAPEERYTDLALGFGVGGKFISRQGFFLDLGMGIGRNLFSSNSPTIVGQFNFNLGFRF